MRNADDCGSGVVYEFSETKLSLEDMKSQMETCKELKHVERKTELEQLC